MGKNDYIRKKRQRGVSNICWGQRAKNVMRLITGVMGVSAVSIGCSSTSDVQQSVQAPWVLEKLSAEQGISFVIPPFPVPSGQEEQSCYFVATPDLNNGQDYWVNRVLMATSTGSHHLNVFRVRTIINLGPDTGVPIQLGPNNTPATVVYGHEDYQTSPCWASANWADWPLVANTESPVGQGPYTNWTLPDGVAMRFTPGETLMIQAHYVNTSVQPTPSEAFVGINFFRTAEANPTELGTLFATQQNIRICQHDNPAPTFSGTCAFPNAVTVTAANGHFHSRGKEFSMFAWDGMSTTQPSASDMFYDSLSWNDPPMSTGLGVPVAQGGGVWWNCSYQWLPPIGGCDAVNAKDPEKENDCCYTFGGDTQVGEHCNAFVYYYPKLTTDAFCN